ncbi:MAG TPA: CorA family divalent cation transporter [Candidatus Paceibacterota bacterium]|jgi:magnesium transporter|nr:CorA family divalent cation transporter [Candidatus Paceibacterota bacterium]
MISKYNYKGLIWVDLESPTEEEINHIMEHYSIPGAVGREILNESIQSKVDLYPNFIYLILHFPQISSKESRSVEKEIDFIVGNEFIITIHYEFIDSINEFSKTFENDAMSNKDLRIEHAGLLFSNLIKTLYINSRRQLHSVNLLLKDTEDKIFEGKEGDMVATISNINRTLLDFKQALRFHKEVLNSFEISAKKFFGEEFGFYISSIINEYNKTRAILDSHKEILDDLRNTNDSLLANKTKETMKILTIITFLVSPITVIANIFMINSNFLKTGNINHYYLVLLLMFTTSLLAYLYIKTKKWL